MKERIDWDAFKEGLKAAIRNEKLWAMGATGEDFDMHMENIERMQEEIKDIEAGDYEAVLSSYDKSAFEDFLKD